MCFSQFASAWKKFPYTWGGHFDKTTKQAHSSSRVNFECEKLPWVYIWHDSCRADLRVEWDIRKPVVNQQGCSESTSVRPIPRKAFNTDFRRTMKYLKYNNRTASHKERRWAVFKDLGTRSVCSRRLTQTRFETTQPLRGDIVEVIKLPKRNLKPFIKHLHLPNEPIYIRNKLINVNPETSKLNCWQIYPRINEILRYCGTIERLKNWWFLKNDFAMS